MNEKKICFLRVTVQKRQFLSLSSKRALKPQLVITLVWEVACYSLKDGVDIYEAAIFVLILK